CNNGVGILLLIRIAPGNGMSQSCMDMVSLGRKIALRAVIEPAAAVAGHAISIKHLSCPNRCGNACCGLRLRLRSQCCLDVYTRDSGGRFPGERCLCGSRGFGGEPGSALCLPGTS